MVRGGAAELRRGRKTQVLCGQIPEERYKHQGVWQLFGLYDFIF